MLNPTVALPTAQGDATSASTLDSETASFLLDLYTKKRLDYQYNYYQKRYRQFDKNSDSLFRANALLIAVTTLLAALGTNVGHFSSELRLLTALLPSLAGVLTSIGQLHKWEEQSRIYRHSVLGLERSRLLIPITPIPDPEASLNVFHDIVKNTDQVFLDEVNQWGQIEIGR